MFVTLSLVRRRAEIFLSFDIQSQTLTEIKIEGWFANFELNILPTTLGEAVMER